MGHGSVGAEVCSFGTKRGNGEPGKRCKTWNLEPGTPTEGRRDYPESSFTKALTQKAAGKKVIRAL